MEPGRSTEIEYMWPDDVKRLASLEFVEAGDGPFPSTYDPLWIVREFISGNEARFEWLNYIGHDGALWKVKVHASSAGDNVIVRFEHVPYPEGEGHDDFYINFVDWERQPWSAAVPDVFAPSPVQPVFDIKRGPWLP